MSKIVSTKKISPKSIKSTAKKVVSSKPKQIQSNVRDTAQELWLASLGAMSVARKQSNQLLDTLVDESKNLRGRSLQLAGNVAGDVRKQVEGVVGKIVSAANDNYNFVEERVGNGVSRILDRMGVPSKEDIVELSKRVAELSRQVKALQNGRKSTLLGDVQAA